MIAPKHACKKQSRLSITVRWVLLKAGESVMIFTLANRKKNKTLDLSGTFGTKDNEKL
jgi:hypothetical protein